MNLPNVISLGRLLAVPVAVWLVLSGELLVAFWVFVAAGADESLDALLRRAAAALVQQVEDNWKRDNLLQFGRPAVLAVTVRIKGLGDWLVVRKRLAGVAVIRRADLALLSRAAVRVNLHYIGESDQLTLALEQADLTLSTEDDEWILGLKPASSAARAQP